MLTLLRAQWLRREERLRASSYSDYVEICLIAGAVLVIVRGSERLFAGASDTEFKQRKECLEAESRCQRTVALSS